MQGGESQSVNFGQSLEPSGVSDKAVFEWKAASFTQSEKGLKWYLAAAFVILAVIGYSAWQRDWFMIGIVVVVSGVMFWYQRAMTPHEVSYRLTPMGIYIDDRFYAYSEMHSFWLVYNQNVKSLYIVFRKRYLPALNINVEALDPMLLKGYLVRRLPEQENRDETLIDRLGRLLRM